MSPKKYIESCHSLIDAEYGFLTFLCLNHDDRKEGCLYDIFLGCFSRLTCEGVKDLHNKAYEEASKTIKGLIPFSVKFHDPISVKIFGSDLNDLAVCGGNPMQNLEEQARENNLNKGKSLIAI